MQINPVDVRSQSLCAGVWVCFCSSYLSAGCDWKAQVQVYHINTKSMLVFEREIAAESWPQMVLLPSAVHGHIKSPVLPSIDFNYFYLKFLLTSLSPLQIDSRMPPSPLHAPCLYLRFIFSCWADWISGAFLVNYRSASVLEKTTQTHLPDHRHKLPICPTSTTLIIQPLTHQPTTNLWLEFTFPQ